MSTAIISDVKIIPSLTVITFKWDGDEMETNIENQEEYEELLNSIFEVWDTGGITVEQACNRYFQDNIDILLLTEQIVEAC